MTTLGVDLGTSNSTVAVLRGDGAKEILSAGPPATRP
jgi:molecular chaperone DnaK (HSP70)